MALIGDVIEESSTFVPLNRPATFLKLFLSKRNRCLLDLATLAARGDFAPRADRDAARLIGTKVVIFAWLGRWYIRDPFPHAQFLLSSPLRVELHRVCLIPVAF